MRPPAQIAATGKVYSGGEGGRLQLRLWVVWRRQGGCYVPAFDVNHRLHPTRSIAMNNCVRKHHRQRIGSMPAKPSAETELQLLRAAVAALQQMGLMDHDVLEQTRRRSQAASPRA